MLWDVWHNDVLVDVVCFDNSIAADEVKTSLINHDGYPNTISVTQRQPCYDVSYVVEKANMIIRGANAIIDATRRTQTTNVRSYYIGGVLEIEQALNGLHAKFNDIMKACNETEKDYGLRKMGEVKFKE